MKIEGKRKSIEYWRLVKHDLCPGALWGKTYFVGKNEINVNCNGIYDCEKKKYTNRQLRKFLYPEEQK